MAKEKIERIEKIKRRKSAIDEFEEENRREIRWSFVAFPLLKRRKK